MIRRMLRGTSIRLRLPIAIGAPMALVLVALVWIGYLKVARAARESAGHRLGAVTAQLASLLASDARRTAASALDLSHHPAFSAYLQEPDAAHRTAALAALRESAGASPRVASVELWNATLRRILAVGPDTGLVSHLWVNPAVPPLDDADSAALGPFLAAGDSLFLPAIALIADSGELAGYYVEWFRVSASRAERDLFAGLIGPQASFFLGARQGVWTDRSVPIPPPPVPIIGDSAVLRYERAGMGRRFALARPVAGTPWLVLVELPAADVLAPARRFLTDSGPVVLILFAMGVIAVWLVTRQVTAPLARIAIGAEALSRGDYSSRVPVDRADELGRLADAFNTMAERIEQAHEHLQEKIAELQAARDQFAHAQRMEAVGRLAGGIAHDFNNILTAIMGEAELTSLTVPPGSEARVGLEEIQRSAGRAATLTRQLLTFSRRQLVELTVFSVDDLVEDLRKMLRRVLRENIELVVRHGSNDPAVRADRGQIEQVIVNLAVNARDAMPQGGRLIVETANITLDESYAELREEVQPGRYVQVTVSDTGIGMSPEVQSHIFEPFFTTKPPGSGSGLGLATSYGIVKQSGGHIAVYSEVGVGTTIKVYLPSAGAAPLSPEAAPIPDLRGEDTILLVEDDDGVRGVAARILRNLGYTVVEAVDGETALDLLSRQGGGVRLMLTDVVLPGLSGRELAEQALKLWPHLRILFASGYTDDVILRHQLVARDVALLQKPFTSATLGRKVREVLDQPPSPSGRAGV